MGTTEIIEALHVRWDMGTDLWDFTPAWVDDTLSYAERNLSDYELQRIERLALSLY